ncbi:hypothetical protein SAMN05192529_104134 [Arachidicoccus rhizosphaerae]|jgi:hypothetical protein|uniref:Uncharacterized protein n=1 Tax=Arachidicoccus rhizosphaerae TaxID=551991 RepID=A0A1H3X168_9BACT|nr:hypothetical protein SAMN05192529_104134 [Arachidicoccus rhizosphaerae]
MASYYLYINVLLIYKVTNVDLFYNMQGANHQAMNIWGVVR